MLYFSSFKQEASPLSLPPTPAFAVKLNKAAGNRVDKGGVIGTSALGTELGERGLQK